LLASESDPLNRHFTYVQLEEALYKSRDSFDRALDEYDAACEAHDDEMVTIRPALLANFDGKLPRLGTYRQQTIRQSKARCFPKMLWWARRGIDVYGDDALNPGDVRDLETRASAAEDRLAAETVKPVAACQSCGVVLDPPPTRTRICSECGENIVVRTERGTGRKFFLTAEGAAQFDAAKAVAAIRKKALRNVEAMGLTVADYDVTFAQLAGEWGHDPGPGEVYWSLANQQIVLLRAQQRKDPLSHAAQVQQIYRDMAQQLQEEGRPYQHLMRQAHNAHLIGERARLKDMFGSEVAEWRMKVLANACCDSCRRLDGQTYTFERAIEAEPLPSEECTRDWCNCIWLTVPPSL
jgi:predicted RNA-binding Zn-ribbon protein involved in translation (DUF1610 family)